MSCQKGLTTTLNWEIYRKMERGYFLCVFCSKPTPRAPSFCHNIILWWFLRTFNCFQVILFIEWYEAIQKAFHSSEELRRWNRRVSQSLTKKKREVKDKGCSHSNCLRRRSQRIISNRFVFTTTHKLTLS